MWLNAEKIRFTYPNYQFNLLSTRRSAYDCEAMVCKGDSIFLFSKNWENFTTTVYRLPKTPGRYTAETVNTFDCKGLITASCYYNNTLYLLGYSLTCPFLWVFQNIKNFKLSEAQGKRIELTDLAGAQAEGIAATDSCIYISSEKATHPQSLYTLKLIEIEQP